VPVSGVQDVLLTVDISEKGSAGDHMDSCSLGAQASEESGHRNKHQRLRW
jgi:hypothetical protein